MIFFSFGDPVVLPAGFFFVFVIKLAAGTDPLVILEV